MLDAHHWKYYNYLGGQCCRAAPRGRCAVLKWCLHHDTGVSLETRASPSLTSAACKLPKRSLYWITVFGASDTRRPRSPSLPLYITRRTQCAAHASLRPRTPSLMTRRAPRAPPFRRTAPPFPAPPPRSLREACKRAARLAARLAPPMAHDAPRASAAQRLAPCTLRVARSAPRASAARRLRSPPL